MPIMTFIKVISSLDTSNITPPKMFEYGFATTLAFTGDSTYKGSVKAVTVTISKQATKLTVAKKTFKKSATKKVTAVLKDSKGKGY